MINLILWYANHSWWHALYPVLNLGTASFVFYFYRPIRARLIRLRLLRRDMVRAVTAENLTQAQALFDQVDAHFEQLIK